MHRFRSIFSSRFKRRSIMDCVLSLLKTNGCRLLVFDSHFISGDINDPADSTGLTSAMASMLTEGTENYTSLQLAEKIERLGSSISASASDDFTIIAASALSLIQFGNFAFAGRGRAAADVSRERTRPLSAQHDRASQISAFAARFSRRRTGGAADLRRPSICTSFAKRRRY